MNKVVVQKTVIHKSFLKKLAGLCILFLFSTASSFAVTVVGNAEGNSSEGKKQPDGTIVLADLLKDQKFLHIVPDRKKFLDDVVGFRELLLDIASVHPYFSASIWTTLMTTEIYEYEGTFQQQPLKQRDFALEDISDEQLALHYPGYIIYSRPDFSVFKDKPYSLVREAIHQMTPPSKMEGPLAVVHNLLIRELNFYISTHRGTLNGGLAQAELGRRLNAIGVESQIFAFFYANPHPVDRLFNESVLKLLLAEEGDFKARCAFLVGVDYLYGEYRRDDVSPDEYLMDIRKSFDLKVFLSWGNYSKCQAEGLHDLKISRYPKLEEILRDAVQYVDFMKIFEDGITLEFCNNYASLHLKSLLDGNEKKLTDRNSKLEVLRQIVANESDPAWKVFDQYYFNYSYNGYSMMSYYKRDQDKLKEDIDRFNANTNLCSTKYVLKNGVWKKR